MHGLIQVAFRGFIKEKFGDSAWLEILKGTGIEDETWILQMKYYDDTRTMAAVSIGAEVGDATNTETISESRKVQRVGNLVANIGLIQCSYEDTDLF